MLTSFDHIRNYALSLGKKKGAIPMAEDKTSLLTAQQARQLGLVKIILIGRKSKIKEILNQIDASFQSFEMIDNQSPKETAQKAVSLAREGICY
ncbi:MAG: phosphate acyltransferase [Candidatus Aminicenantia bacterium]